MKTSLEKGNVLTQKENDNFGLVAESLKKKEKIKRKENKKVKMKIFFLPNTLYFWDTYFWKSHKKKREEKHLLKIVKNLVRFSVFNFF